MRARERESWLLDRCAAVGRGDSQPPRDRQEAHVFQVAAGIIRSTFPQEAGRLQQASERFFASHPGEQLATSEVVRNGWVASLPRLRDMLTRRLGGVSR